MQGPWSVILLTSSSPRFLVGDPYDSPPRHPISSIIPSPSPTVWHAISVFPAFLTHPLLQSKWLEERPVAVILAPPETPAVPSAFQL